MEINHECGPNPHCFTGGCRSQHCCDRMGCITTTTDHTYRCGHRCTEGKRRCQLEERHTYECDDCFAVSQASLAAVKHDPATDFEDGYGSGAGWAGIDALAGPDTNEALFDNDDAQVAGY